MRKLFSLLFVFLLVFPVTACGQSKGEESGTVVDAEIIPVTDAAESAQETKTASDAADSGAETEEKTNRKVDLMLLHHPDPNDVEAYKTMEQFVEEGKIRSIGLSNWYVEELTEFLPQVDTVPALVQNEIHPYYQENDVIPFIQELGIVVQGWYPLGGRGHTGVILRWNLQKGVAVIPGSSNPDHIRENTELYHFSLTEDEMARIGALDRNEKHDWY